MYNSRIDRIVSGSVIPIVSSELETFGGSALARTLLRRSSGMRETSTTIIRVRPIRSIGVCYI